MWKDVPWRLASSSLAGDCSQLCSLGQETWTVTVPGCHKLFLLNMLSAGVNSSAFFVRNGNWVFHQLNVSITEVRLLGTANKNLVLEVLPILSHVIGIKTSPGQPWKPWARDDAIFVVVDTRMSAWSKQPDRQSWFWVRHAFLLYLYPCTFGLLDTAI